jgi:hypothetical protein
LVLSGNFSHCPPGFIDRNIALALRSGHGEFGHDEKNKYGNHSYFHDNPSFNSPP